MSTVKEQIYKEQLIEALALAPTRGECLSVWNSVANSFKPSPLEVLKKGLAKGNTDAISAAHEQLGADKLTPSEQTELLAAWKRSSTARDINVDKEIEIIQQLISLELLTSLSTANIPTTDINIGLISALLYFRHREAAIHALSLVTPLQSDLDQALYYCVKNGQQDDAGTWIKRIIPLLDAGANPDSQCYDLSRSSLKVAQSVSETVLWAPNKWSDISLTKKLLGEKVELWTTPSSVRGDFCPMATWIRSKGDIDTAFVFAENKVITYEAIPNLLQECIYRSIEEAIDISENFNKHNILFEPLENHHVIRIGQVMAHTIVTSRNKNDNFYFDGTQSWWEPWQNIVVTAAKHPHTATYILTNIRKMLEDAAKSNDLESVSMKKSNGEHKIHQAVKHIAEGVSGLKMDIQTEPAKSEHKKGMRL